MKLSFSKRLSLVLMCVVIIFSSFLFSACVETTYVPKGRAIFLYNEVDKKAAGKRLDSQYNYFVGLAQNMLKLLYDAYGPSIDSTPINNFLGIALGGDVMNALPTMNYVNYVDFTLDYVNKDYDTHSPTDYHILALSVDSLSFDSICSREEASASTRFTIKACDDDTLVIDSLYWTGSNEFYSAYHRVGNTFSSRTIGDDGYIWFGDEHNFDDVFFEFDSNNQMCAIYFIGNKINGHSIATAEDAYNFVRDIYSKDVLGNTYAIYRSMLTVDKTSQTTAIINGQTWKHSVGKEAINSRQATYGGVIVPRAGFDNESEKFYLGDYSIYLAALLAKSYLLGNEACSETNKTFKYYDVYGNETSLTDTSLQTLYQTMDDSKTRSNSETFFKCLMSNKRNLNELTVNNVKTKFVSVIKENVISNEIANNTTLAFVEDFARNTLLRVIEEDIPGVNSFAEACFYAVNYGFIMTKFIYDGSEKSLSEFTFPEEFIMHSSKVHSFMETDSLDVSNADIGAYSYLSSLILYSYPKDIEVEVDDDVFDESDPKEKKEKKELEDEARENAENDFAPMTISKISLTATLADESEDYSELENATVLLIIRNGWSINTQTFSLSKTSTQGEYALNLENNIGSIKSKKEGQPLTPHEDIPNWLHWVAGGLTTIAIDWFINKKSTEDRVGKKPGMGSDDDIVDMQKQGVISYISNNISWASYGYGQYYAGIEEEESYAQLVFLSKEDNGPLAVKITSLDVQFRS